MNEQHRRSVAKGLSWRFFATIDTIILAYIFTGTITAALSIGGLEVLTKVGWYYLHERAWLRVGSSEELTSSWIGHGSHARGVLKAISWRAVGALDTVLIALIVTRHLGVSASIGGAELITKLLLYYLHERLWLNVQWGVVRGAPSRVLRSRIAGLFAVVTDAFTSLKQKAKVVLYALACVVFLLLMAGIAYIVQ